MPVEAWSEIEGTDYSVSDFGRVASQKIGWRTMKPRLNRTGYLQLRIRTVCGQRQRLVHQLVAEAFLGPKPTPSHQVNHKNGDRTDNRAVNLEWATSSENNQHAYDALGKKALRGEANGSAKLTGIGVRGIRAGVVAGETQTDIAARFGVGQATVSRIANGKSWTWLP